MIGDLELITNAFNLPNNSRLQSIMAGRSHWLDWEEILLIISTVKKQRQVHAVAQNLSSTYTVQDLARE